MAGSPVTARTTSGLTGAAGGGGEMAVALADLASLHAALGALVRGLTAAQWEAGTPARGWSVRDQVAHLADTDEVARDTVAGGPRGFREAVSGFPDAESFTEAGCVRGRGMSVGELARWSAWAAADCHAALTATAAAERVAAIAASTGVGTANAAGELAASSGGQARDGTRVTWGLGMSVLDFVRARIMEHWAHGLDIRAAIGAADTAVPVLPHVARLGAATVPYALASAGIRRPAGHTLRFVLEAEEGSALELGEQYASDVVTGPLAAWCRVAVRRPRPGDRESLNASGPLAQLAVARARAYL